MSSHLPTGRMRNRSRHVMMKSVFAVACKLKRLPRRQLTQMFHLPCSAGRAEGGGKREESNQNENVRDAASSSFTRYKVRGASVVSLIIITWPSAVSRFQIPCHDDFNLMISIYVFFRTRFFLFHFFRTFFASFHLTKNSGPNIAL